jgi:hypothetical protein
VFEASKSLTIVFHVIIRHHAADVPSSQPLSPSLPLSKLPATSVLTRNSLLLHILSPLLTPALGLLNPLIIRAIPLVQFRFHHTLQQLANEPHEIMSAQRILPEPLCPPVFLMLELLLVADFAGTDAQVAHAREQVEADFGGWVALDAAL